MSWKKHEYEEIPGTYVFDGKTSHSSYGLNKLFYSFNQAENRQAFAEDPAGYADRFDLTDEQRQALLSGDFLTLLKMGANIYYLAKLAIPSGTSVQDAGASFHGISTEEFKALLQGNAEGFQEKLREAGGFWNG